MKTFDIVFNDSEQSNCKGFKSTLEYCKNYIETHNGSNNSYFKDYKSGTVQIICNQTEEIVYQTEIK